VALTRNINPVRFKVRKDAARGENCWVCDFHAHGKRLRRFFPAEELAWAEGAKLTAQVTEKGTASLSAPEGGLTVAKAIRMWVNEQEPRSDSHREKIEIFQRAFPKAFSGPVGQIEGAALRRWVKTRSPNAITQAMYFRYARMFFGYLAANRLIEHDPMDAVPAPRGRSTKNILTPAQMKALLKLEMPDYLRALFLLGGFAGIRTEEVCRMSWENINAQTGQIHVPPDAIKQSPGGFDQRITDFTEPLTRRAKFFTGKQGRIIPVASETLHTLRRAVIGPVLDGWPNNCLRHSFATYHLARCKSAPVTAFQMGHTSAHMVQSVYAVPAALADWKAWWQL
jgi:integrase